MKKLLMFLTGLLLYTSAASAQTSEELKQFPVKRGAKNAIFDKVFSDIVTSGAHYFKSLETDGLKSIMDTTYNLKFDFREKNDATLTCAKDNVSLTINFNLPNDAYNAFFRNLNVELPANYVYTEEYDADAKQYNYTFFAKPGTKTIPPNYPETIMMIRDASDNVLLTFLLFR